MPNIWIIVSIYGVSTQNSYSGIKSVYEEYFIMLKQTTQSKNGQKT